MNAHLNEALALRRAAEDLRDLMALLYRNRDGSLHLPRQPPSWFNPERSLLGVLMTHVAMQGIDPDSIPGLIERLVSPNFSWPGRRPAWPIPGEQSASPTERWAPGKAHPVQAQYVRFLNGLLSILD